MFPKPRVSENHVLFSEAGYCKVSTFGVVLVTEYDVHYFSDGSCFVRTAIYIVDWDATTKSPGCELVPMHIILINEKSGGSTINESLDGLRLLSVRGDDLHLNV
jgi:hypothetical protein